MNEKLIWGLVILVIFLILLVACIKLRSRKAVVVPRSYRQQSGRRETRVNSPDEGVEDEMVGEDATLSPMRKIKGTQAYHPFKHKYLTEDTFMVIPHANKSEGIPRFYITYNPLVSPEKKAQCYWLQDLELYQKGEDLLPNAYHGLYFDPFSSYAANTVFAIVIVNLSVFTREDEIYGARDALPSDMPPSLQAVISGELSNAELQRVYISWENAEDMLELPSYIEDDEWTRGQFHRWVKRSSGTPLKNMSLKIWFKTTGVQNIRIEFEEKRNLPLLL